MKNILLIASVVVIFAGCSPQTQQQNAEKLTSNASEVKAKVQTAIDLGAQKIAAAESQAN